MKAYRRPLAPREIDHELLWLVVSGATFAGLAFWLAARLPTPQCAFRSLTGLPCVTCGATRAAIQFFHGHFAASFLFNPLAFLTLCSLLAFDLYALTVLIARAPRVRLGNFSRAEKRLARSVAIILLAGNWIYLLTAHPF
ncbi:MAG TPA: DUF2752 domain-containing protein [Chthoniobacterales bacterium]|jgi:hypothetical protein|nr:DUF2752 domain-containing protein [Chthoniobacterales bacterium]